MRKLDWAATALGEPDGWPHTLKTLVSVILAAARALQGSTGPV